MDKSTKMMYIFVLFWIIGGILTWQNEKYTHIEQGDCFDEKVNKINELTCDIKVYDSLALKIGIVSSFIVGISFAFYGIYLAFIGR